MAICDICSKKIGFSEERHMLFESGDVLLCDQCNREKNRTQSTNAEEAEIARKYFVDTLGMNINSGVKAEIKSFLDGLKDRSDEADKIKEQRRKIIEHENDKINFAKSFNEFYEYDVITIINERGGLINNEQMQKTLSDYAKKGWKLHTMYSNELGKEAVAMLGIGINKTLCEDVMIFERRISNLE